MWKVPCEGKQCVQAVRGSEKALQEWRQIGVVNGDALVWSGRKDWLEAVQSFYVDKKACVRGIETKLRYVSLTVTSLCGRSNQEGAGECDG